MEKILDLMGTLSGALGVLLCLASAVGRVTGVMTFAGSEIVSWFVLGLGLVAVGCFGKLQAMSLRTR